MMRSADDRARLVELQARILDTVEAAAAAPIGENVEARPSLDAWIELSDTYLSPLIASDAAVPPQTFHVLADALAFLSRGVHEGDIGALHRSTAAFAALPGNPTIGVKPPYDIDAAPPEPPPHERAPNPPSQALPGNPTIGLRPPGSPLPYNPRLDVGRPESEMRDR